MKEERRSATRRREDYRALAGLRKAPSVAAAKRNNNNRSNKRRNNVRKSKKNKAPARATTPPKTKTEYELELERNVEDVVNVILAEVKLKEHNKTWDKPNTKSRRADTTIVVTATKVLPSPIASTSITNIVEQPEYQLNQEEQQNEPEENNTIYTKDVQVQEQSSVATPSAAAAAAPPSQPKRKRKKSGTSSDEERWLDAIEAGKLVQIDDELKKIKDPKLMTARQRAMYDRVSGHTINNNNVITITETSEIVHNGGSSLNSGIPIQFTNQLIALPTGYKEKVMTAEAIEKAQIKNQKRKQMADAKREYDKKRTMERLLKKKETKVVKPAVKLRVPINKAECPTITYRSSVNGGNTIEFPNNYDLFRLNQNKKRSSSSSSSSSSPPPVELCTICNAPKRYNYGKTNIPICSLQCYKQIGAMTKAMMC